ncbi:hypothetical protein F5882DRAFT_416769 [Hyaloscypha sp. PMI_1271]|nr:hypothetical protein F5882DRAFT_416769 [Hyaloscypha sp. PMI_1271]
MGYPVWSIVRRFCSLPRRCCVAYVESYLLLALFTAILPPSPHSLGQRRHERRCRSTSKHHRSDDISPLSSNKVSPMLIEHNTNFFRNRGQFILSDYIISGGLSIQMEMRLHRRSHLRLHGLGPLCGWNLSKKKNRSEEIRSFEINQRGEGGR